MDRYATKYIFRILTRSNALPYGKIPQGSDWSFWVPVYYAHVPW